MDTTNLPEDKVLLISDGMGVFEMRIYIVI